jgi:hypothetical protein
MAQAGALSTARQRTLLADWCALHRRDLLLSARLLPVASVAGAPPLARIIAHSQHSKGDPMSRQAQTLASFCGGCCCGTLIYRVKL